MTTKARDNTPKQSEILTRACIKAVTGRELEHIHPLNDIPDLFSLSSPSIACEVKEVTVEEARRQSKSIPSFCASSVLTQRWLVNVPTPTLDQRLPLSSTRLRRPVSEETRAAVEAAGFRVLEPPPPTTPAPVFGPDLKHLCSKLEPLLSQLEGWGVTITRAAHPFLDVDLVVGEIEQLTGGGIAMSFDPMPGQLGGIELRQTIGIVLIGHPDGLLARMEEYLNGAAGVKLRSQLGSCTSFAERHAALVLDPTEPEWHRRRHWAPYAVPTAAPSLPEMIDALWMIVGDRCLHWHPASGWMASEVPAIPPQA